MLQRKFSGASSAATHDENRANRLAVGKRTLADDISAQAPHAAPAQSQCLTDTLAPPRAPSSVVVGAIQRKCASCGELTTGAGACPACGGNGNDTDQNDAGERGTRDSRVQGRSEQPDLKVPGLVNEVLSSSGQPLPENVRSRFESNIGHDFRDVRVHTDGAAAESAQQIQAKAYTHGNHVVFGSGQYAPNTAAGQQLLGHELAHVVQQSRGGSPGRLELGAPDTAAEFEADAVAQQVVGGAALPVAIGGTGAGVVQRAGENHAADTAAPVRRPRSLFQTLDPSALSDSEIEQEVGEIRAWFDANPASSATSEMLAHALGRLGHEFVMRHRASLPAGDPRGASSITPADVRRASSSRLGGAAMGFTAVPGLVPAPPPVPMPPPVIAPPAPVAPPAPIVAPPAPVPSPPLAPVPRPVPIPPVAAGVLAFFLILLWPRDSIMSGDEERRLLEQSRRRQPQGAGPPQPGTVPGPATGPAPPIPAPVPPRGEGPNERRHDDQTCENRILDDMQAAMHNVCDRIPGDSCSPSRVSPKRLDRRPCSQIRTRIRAIRECIRLRQEIQDHCFGGRPDPIHAGVLEQLQNGLTACLALEAVNCAPGHPMANL